MAIWHLRKCIFRCQLEQDVLLVYKSFGRFHRKQNLRLFHACFIVCYMLPNHMKHVGCSIYYTLSEGLLNDHLKSILFTKPGIWITKYKSSLTGLIKSFHFSEISIWQNILNFHKPLHSNPNSHLQFWFAEQRHQVLLVPPFEVHRHPVMAHLIWLLHSHKVWTNMQKGLGRGK